MKSDRATQQLTSGPEALIKFAQSYPNQSVETMTLTMTLTPLVNDLSPIKPMSWKPLGSHFSEHLLTCVSRCGPLPKNKPLLSLLQNPIHWALMHAGNRPL